MFQIRNSNQSTIHKVIIKVPHQRFVWNTVHGHLSHSEPTAAAWQCASENQLLWSHLMTTVEHCASRRPDCIPAVICATWIEFSSPTTSICPSPTSVENTQRQQVLL